MTLIHFPCYLPFPRGFHRSPVDSPHKGPVTASFDVFFDVHVNQRLYKQWSCRLIETPWRPCDVILMVLISVKLLIDFNKKKRWSMTSILLIIHIPHGSWMTDAFPFLEQNLTRCYAANVDCWIKTWLEIIPILLPLRWKMAELTVHYTDVIMDAMASQITSITIVYSTVYSGADQTKH